MGTPELFFAAIGLPVILFAVVFGWLSVRELKRPERNTISIILILLVISTASCGCGSCGLFLLGG